jgi:hypothetical protein
MTATVRKSQLVACLPAFLEYSTHQGHATVQVVPIDSLLERQRRILASTHDSAKMAEEKAGGSR